MQLYTFAFIGLPIFNSRGISCKLQKGFKKEKWVVIPKSEEIEYRKQSCSMAMFALSLKIW